MDTGERVNIGDIVWVNFGLFLRFGKIIEPSKLDHVGPNYFKIYIDKDTTRDIHLNRSKAASDTEAFYWILENS